jgi:hypothetical protein
VKRKLLVILTVIFLVTPLWSQSPAKLAALTKRVVGKWVTADGKGSIEFRPDGSCSEDDWKTQDKLSGWPQGDDFSCQGGVLSLISPNTMTQDYGMGGVIEKFHRLQANLPNQSRTSAEKDAIFDRLAGKWEGNIINLDPKTGRYKRGAEQQCEFIRDAKGVKFIGRDGQITPEDDVYLTYLGGKLHGSYEFGKHGGAHGNIWTQKFTLTLKADNTLLFDDSNWKVEYHKTGRN